MIKIKQEYPPNIEEIKRYLETNQDTIYAYGSFVYNPSGKEIPPDVLTHENVHSQQQKNFASPELWWSKYLIDREFRKQEEVEAFAKQWRWIKPYLPSQGVKDALNEFAQLLSSPLYDLDLTHSQAETLIRYYEK